MTDEPVPLPAKDEQPQEPPPPPAVEVPDEAALEAERRRLEEENDADVDRRVRSLSRRGFLAAAVAAGAGYGAWKFLNTRQRLLGVQWPLRRVLELNESVAEAYYRNARLGPTFPPSRITRPARVNGGLGLDPNFDPATWRLRIEGTPKPLTLTLDDIKALPRREQITEFRCIEGWSMIVKWTGTRLADVMAKFPPAEPRAVRRDGDAGPRLLRRPRHAERNASADVARLRTQ